MPWILLIAALSLPSDPIFIDSAARSSDKADGSESHPFATLTAALKHLEAADSSRTTTLHIAPGRYDDELGEAYPLSLPKNVRLVGRGPAPSILASASETLLAIETEGPRSLVGLRFEATDRAIQVSGCGDRETAVSLSLSRCQFEGGRIGLTLMTDETGSNHRVDVTGCDFSGLEIAGILRRGRGGANRSAQPYLIEACTFENNDIGVHFEKPCADATFRIRDCAFRQNTHYGVRFAGENGDPSRRSFLEDCRFESNGIGIYLVNLQTPCVVTRSRVSKSLGAGIFASNFAARHSKYVLTNCLIDGNGADGIGTVSDGESLSLIVLNSTVADNGTYGLRGKWKHGGRAQLSIGNSVFFRNSKGPSTGVSDENFSHCLKGEGVRAEFFVNADGRDYRPREGSALIDVGSHAFGESFLELDFARNRRVRDGDGDGRAQIDLGAYEFHPDENEAQEGPGREPQESKE